MHNTNRICLIILLTGLFYLTLLTMVFAEPAQFGNINPITFTEGDPPRALCQSITLTDDDGPNLTYVSVQITGNYTTNEDVLAAATLFNITPVFNPITGELRLNSAASNPAIDFQTVLQTVTYHNLNTINPSAAPRAITFLADDGDDGLDVATINTMVTIFPVDDAPAIYSANTPYFFEGLGAVPVDPAFSIIDGDGFDPLNPLVYVTVGFNPLSHMPGEDVLAAPSMHGISVNFDPLQGILSLTGSVNVADYEDVLQAMTYNNTNEINPSELPRQIITSLSSGSFQNIVTMNNLVVIGINDPPTLDAQQGVPSVFIEDGPPVFVSPNLILEDLDGPSMIGGIANLWNYVPGEDSLVTDCLPNVICEFYNGWLNMRSISTNPYYEIRDLFQAVRYINVNHDNPNPTPRAIIFTVNDGSGFLSDTTLVYIQPMEDPIEVLNPLADVDTIEDSDNIFINVNNVFFDPDMDNQELIQIAVTFNTNVDLVQASIIPSSTTLFLNFADNQTGSATITLSGTSFFLTPSAITTSFTVNVAPVNDPPTVANTIAEQIAVEDNTFSYQFPADTFSDVDGDMLTYSARDPNGPLPNDWLSFDSQTRTFTGLPINEHVGTVNITLTAADIENESAQTVFQISIQNTNDAPTLENPLPDWECDEDQSFVYTLPANTFHDMDVGDELDYNASLLDGSSLQTVWLGFDHNNLILSGVPANDDVGFLEVLITVNDDSSATVSDTLRVTVHNVNDPPVLMSNIPSLIAAEDNIFNYPISPTTFVDVDPGDIVTFSAEAADGSSLADSWLDFSTDFLRFTGTPTNDNVGQLGVRLIATDQSSATSYTDFSILVVNVNDAPYVINSIQNQTGTQDQPFNFTFPDNIFGDDDLIHGDLLRYSAKKTDGSPLPAWLNFDNNTRTFSGTPGNMDIGILTVKVIATDNGGLEAISEFQIHIFDVNDPPLVLNPIPDIIVNEDANDKFIDLSNVFFDPDPMPISFNNIIVSNSGDPELVTATIEFNTTLVLSFVDDASGTAEIIIQGESLVRTQNTITDTFLVTVTPVNDPPMIQTMSNQFIDEDGTLVQTVNFNDPDLNDTHTITVTSTDPTNVPISGLNGYTSGSTFSLTPVPNWHGVVTISVTVTDAGSAYSTASYTLTVNAINDPPILVPTGDQFTGEEQPKTMLIRFYDYDGSLDTHTVTVVSDNPNVQVLNCCGNVWGSTYTLSPAANWNGTAMITITVVDAAGTSDSETYALVVSDANDAPIITDVANQQMNEDAVKTMTISYTDEDPNDTHTVTVVSDDPAIAIENLSPPPHISGFTTYDLVPAQNWNGIATITVTVTDAAGFSSSDVYILNVLNVNDPPVMTPLANQEMDEDSQLSIPVYFSDADTFSVTDIHTITAVTSNPTEVIVSNCCGSLSGSTFTLQSAPDWFGSTIVTVTVTDNALSPADDSKSFVLTVNGVNDAPVLLTPLGNQTLLEDGSLPMTLEFMDADPFENLTVVINVTNEAIHVENMPPPPHTSPLDFVIAPEIGWNGTAQITVYVRDSQNASDMSTFMLTVTGDNDGPVIANEIPDVAAAEDEVFSFQLPEDTFFDADNDPLTYSMNFNVLNNLSADDWLLFDPQTGEFSGVPSNNEVGPTLVTVTASDETRESVSDQFEIVVTNTNDPPFLAVPIADQTASEDQLFTFTIPAITFVDDDLRNDLDVLTFSVTTADPTQDWWSFDPETKTLIGTPLNVHVGEFELTVIVEDMAGEQASDIFSITITNSNDAPRVLNPISTQVAPEDKFFRFTLPDTIFVDEDPNDQLTYSAARSDGSPLGGDFWLSFSPDSLLFSGTPDNSDVGYEDFHLYGVKVRATDLAGAHTSTTFEISVININDAPEITPAQFSDQVYTEGDEPIILFNSVSLSDVDNLVLKEARISISAGYHADQDSLLIDSWPGLSTSFNNGMLMVACQDTINFAPISDFETILASVQYMNTNQANPATNSRLITLTVEDPNGGDKSASVIVNLNPINDAPLIEVQQTLDFTEGDPPSVIDDTIEVSDPDDAMIEYAWVRIVSGFTPDEDFLSAEAPPVLSVNFDNDTGILLISGAAPPTVYQAAMQSVAYANASDNPSPAIRMVAFLVSDGELTNMAETTITMTPVNDAPVVDIAANVLYSEDEPAIFLDPVMNITDSDGPAIESAVFSFTAGYMAAEDRLQVQDTGNIVTDFDETSGELTLTGSASAAEYQAMLRQVRYENLNRVDPDPTIRQLQLAVQDSEHDIGTDSIELTVNPVNDPPALTVIDTTSYQEGTSAQPIDHQISLQDGDSPTIQGAVITIRAGYQAGEDVLSASNQSGIFPFYSNGVLTLTGAAAVTDYEAVLQTVAYENTNTDDPHAQDRLLKFEINDGGAVDSAQTIIHLMATDDPSTITLNDSFIYNEDDPPQLLDSTMLVADVDDDYFTVVFVRIVGNYHPEEDRLSAGDMPGIISSFDVATGKLSFSGDGPLDEYQAALQTVRYENINSGNPSPDIRQVVYTVSTAALAVSDTMFVNINPINDPPEISPIAINPINEGGSFPPIPLNNFVEDVDNDLSEISWSFAGNTELTIALDEHNRASVTTPGNDWFGTENIIFMATDPHQATAADTVIFSVNSINDPPQLVDMPADSLDTHAIIDASFSYSIPKAIFYDVDNTLSYGATDAGGHDLQGGNDWLNVAISETDFNFFGTPELADEGDFLVVLTASDEEYNISTSFIVMVFEIAPRILAETIRIFDGATDFDQQQTFPLENAPFSIKVDIESEIVDNDTLLSRVDLVYGAGWQTHSEAARFEMNLESIADRTFNYVGHVPAEAVTADGFWYRLEAVGELNELNQTAIYPPLSGGTDREPVIIEIEDFARIRERGLFPDGLPAETWSTVSIPYDGTLSLENVLGSQEFNSSNDPTNWIAFKYNPVSQKLEETGEMRAILGYILNHRLDDNPFLVPIDNSLNYTMDMADFDQFIISPQNNLFGWPFPYPAAVSINDNEMTGSVWQLINGGWVIADTLQAFSGYYIYSKLESLTNLGEIITVQPFDPQAGAAATVSAKRNGGGDWSIQWSAATTQRHDRDNFCGVAHHASDEVDAYDEFEPPGIADYLALYFAHRDEDTDEIRQLAFDIRNSNEAGHTWDMQIDNRTESPSVHITWTPDQVPSNFQMMLIDVSHREFIPLSTTQASAYDFYGQQGQFKIVIGTADYVAAATDEIARTLPLRYELSQNFPNPFNPVTTINYAIPQSGPVSLVVYDITGRQVKTLVNDYRETGYYSATWDSRNNAGYTVASGIYFYRLTADNFCKTNQMILLK